MNPAPMPARRRYPHADLWAFATMFFLSRVHWVIALHYHASPYATASIFVSLLAALMMLAAAYVIALLVGEHLFEHLARAAVLAMLFFLIVVQFHYIVYPSSVISVPWQVAIAIIGLALAGTGAVVMRGVWPRLRAAVLAATIIGTSSGPVLAMLLARPIELLGDGGQRHRPVVVLLLDEFSAGSAEALVTGIRARGIHVDSYPVPSIGKDTIDVIPAIFSGATLGSARSCSSTAICGHGRVVDFARMRVLRDDVDIVGIYHRYCAISGLRSCVNPETGFSQPVTTWFLCALPLRLVLGKQLGCDRPGYAAPGEAEPSSVDEHLFAAPFWSRGGFLYAHLRLPHPPSLSGETRLADAYAANLARVETMVTRVIDRLEGSPFHDDYTLIVTSDHHLRADYWCKQSPYAANDCELPPEMRTAEVPFIVATRGAEVRRVAPRSNVDLLPIAADLGVFH